MAKQLRMKPGDIEQYIVRLDAMGILKYNKPGEGPQMFFHHYRVDSRHLVIDLNRINRLRKRHEARTAAMIAFLENTAICRERIFLAYFGENPVSDCGHCDVCRHKQAKKITKRQIRGAILDMLQTKSMTLQQLIASYAPADMEQALACIREMVDNGELGLESNVLSVRR